MSGAAHLDPGLERAVREAKHFSPERTAPFSPRLLAPWQGGLLLLILAASITAAEAQADGPPEAPGPFGTLLRWAPFILEGFVLNLAMSFFAMALATVLGLLLGLMQISELRPARRFAWFVTQVFRNTPWLVILFAVILLVPYEVAIGGERYFIPAWIKAVFAFSLPVMANIAEIVRGAIRSIPDGQWESAESLAFSRRQTLWMIILPQCVKRMIPPWMNWYALLTLSTPIASILGVQEAVGNAQDAMEAAGARQGLLIPFYGAILLLFFVYIYPIARWTIWLERRYAVRI